MDTQRYVFLFYWFDHYGFFFYVALEKLYGPHDGPRYLSTIPPIPLKDSHLFKIARSIVNFCFKKISDSAILSMWVF